MDYQYDETGTFHGSREIGTYYLRLQDVTSDASGNAIAGGHGGGDNRNPSPQLGYGMFNSSGTVQQKVIR